MPAIENLEVSVTIRYRISTSRRNAAVVEFLEDRIAPVLDMKTTDFDLDIRSAKIADWKVEVK
jgi:hypothetical protein